MTCFHHHVRIGSRGSRCSQISAGTQYAVEYASHDCLSPSAASAVLSRAAYDRLCPPAEHCNFARCTCTEYFLLGHTSSTATQSSVLCPNPPYFIYSNYPHVISTTPPIAVSVRLFSDQQPYRPSNLPKIAVLLSAAILPPVLTRFVLRNWR